MDINFFDAVNTNIPNPAFNNQYYQPLRGKNNRKIYGVNIHTSERVEYDSIYQATLAISGKKNNGLISKSLAHFRKNGAPVIAYGYEWYYVDKKNTKTPLSDSYQKIPLHLQKKRGRINKGLSKKSLSERGIFKCYVYNENFEVIHKFHKISDCASTLEIPYSKIVKRCAKQISMDSHNPKPLNGLYFQSQEIPQETINYFLNIKKRNYAKT